MSGKIGNIWMVLARVLLIAAVALLPACGGDGNNAVSDVIDGGGTGGGTGGGDTGGGTGGGDTGGGTGGGDTGGGTTPLPPTAVADSLTYDFGNTGIVLPATYLLANDTNGDVASIASVNGTGTDGTVVLNADGSVTYTPPAAFNGVGGTTSFDYTAANNTDPTLESTATVTVTVGTNQALFVDNSGAGGDGSMSAPFNTLLAAETASVAGNTIFVLVGNGTTTGQNQGIILKDNQRLVGQGVDLTFPITLNTVAQDHVVMAAAAAAPAMTNDGTRAALPPGANAEAGGVGVFLANGNEVAGLSIDGTASEGIMGIEVTGFSIHDNVIQNTTTDGIQLMDPAGVSPAAVNEIRANQFLNISTPARNDRAIRIDNGLQDLAVEVETTGTTVELVIDGNTITGGAGDAIRLDAIGAQSVITATISNNEITLNDNGAGFRTEVAAPATAVNPVTSLDIQILGNTITGNTLGGIILIAEGGELSGDVSNNPNISNNGAKGIVLAASAISSVPTMTIDGNTISGNAEEGIDININDGTVAGIAVRNNTVSGNDTLAGGFNVDVATATATLDNPNLCLQLSGNQSVVPGYQLQGTAGTFNLENDAPTSNTPAPVINVAPPGVTLVAQGTCALPQPTTP